MKDKINYEQTTEKKELIKKKALELRKERQEALGSKACDMDSCLEFLKSRPNDEEWLDMCVRNGPLDAPIVCEVCKSILGDDLTLCALDEYDEYLDGMRPKLVLDGNRIEFQEGIDEFTVTAYDMERVRCREMRKDEFRKWKAKRMGMASQNSWLNNCCGDCAKCVELYGVEKIPCYEDVLSYKRARLLDDDILLDDDEEEFCCEFVEDCDFCLEKYGAYCSVRRISL